MKPNRPISDRHWHMTPEPVREYIRYLEDSLGKLQERFNQVEKRVEKLEVRNGKNSTNNSSKPPASDSPYSKPKRKKKTKSKRKKGGQKGHPGHTQQLLEPTLVEPVLPERCQCGCSTFETAQMSPFYTRQHIELPQIQMNVEHYVLHKCTCPECGRTAKATLPHAVSPGYGPRRCAFIAELSGIKAMSRTDVKGF